MKNLKNSIMLLIVVLIWGANWVNMKIGLYYATPLNYLFQRLFFSSFMIAPFLLFAKNGIKGNLKVYANTVILCVIYAISVIFLMVGLEHESAGISSVVTFTQPLFVFALSAIYLRNEITKVRVAGVLVGFGGITTIYLEKVRSVDEATTSIFFLLLSAFFWAVTIVYYKMISRDVHPYWISFLQAAIGSIVVYPFALCTGGVVFISDLSYLLSLAYVTVLSTVIAFFLWFYLLRNEDATKVSSSSLMIPVVALISGSLLLGETINAPQMVGVIMVLAGVYLVNRRVGSDENAKT
ncbi:MAG: DMT family transporter [Nitrososphaeria archaeon]